MSDPLYEIEAWRDLDLAAHVLMRTLDAVFRSERIAPLLDEQTARTLTACKNATSALCEGIDGGNFETVDNVIRPDSTRILNLERALHIARDRLDDDPEGLALIEDACNVSLPIDLERFRQLLNYRDRALDDGSSASEFMRLMHALLPELLARAMSDMWVSQAHSWVSRAESHLAQIHITPEQLDLFLVDGNEVIHRYTQPNPNGAENNGNETTTNDASSKGE